jgi:hypothetical protein
MAVSVEVDQRGEPQAVHASAYAGRNPKQLSRDIESAVRSQLGYPMDHKLISIAATNVERERGVASRLKLGPVGFEVDGSIAKAWVTLTRAGDSYTGWSTGLAHDYDKAKLVAEATLKAVDEYIRGGTDQEEERPLLSLVSVQTEENGAPQSAAMAWVRMVRLTGARIDDTLLGSASVQRDPLKAPARATLDAVNRRLGLFVE